MDRDKSPRREIGLKLRYFRWTIILLVGVFILTKNYWQPQYHSWGCKRIAAELSDHYGLVVRYGDPSEFFVPPQLPLENIPEKGFSIERADVRFAHTALIGVKAALTKYPKNLIKKHLKAVFITGVLKIYNVQGGGSYFDSWIYLSALEKYEQVGNELYAENFHHELSSLLLKGGNFPTTKWKTVNDHEFSYLSRQIDVVNSAAQKNRKDPNDAPSWHNAGFVHDYGMSSLENDFNMYAELAMGKPEKLKQLGLQYPKIKAKTKILVEYYSTLAPELMAYFESVGLIERLAAKEGP